MQGTTYELLAVIVVPKYIRVYTKSQSQNAKYYEKGKKKLPLFYCNKHLYDTQGVREPNNVNFFWKEFPVIRQKSKKMLEFLIDDQGKRVIANPATVGKPSTVNINGQAIYNGNIKRFDRNNMLNQIKDQIRGCITNSGITAITRFPVRIDVVVYDELHDLTFSNGQDWDIDNRFFPYAKAIGDILVDEGIIPNDHIKYITQSAHPIFIPVQDTEDRRLVINIYKDNRDCILTNREYQDFHKEALL